MKFLTERERLVLALIVLAFVTGAGVRHWRAADGMSSPEETALKSSSD